MASELILKYVPIRHVTLSTLNSELVDAEADVSRCREQILMWASSTPAPSISSGGEPIYTISDTYYSVSELIDELLDANHRVRLLQMARDWPDDVVESL